MIRKKMPALLVIILLMLITALLCARSYKAYAMELEQQYPGYGQKNASVRYSVPEIAELPK